MALIPHLHLGFVHSVFFSTDYCKVLMFFYLHSLQEAVFNLTVTAYNELENVSFVVPMVIEGKVSNCIVSDFGLVTAKVCK